MKTTKLVLMTMQSECSPVLMTRPHPQSFPAFRYEAILKKIRDSSSAAFEDSDDDDDDDVHDDAPIDSVDCVAQVTCLAWGLGVQCLVLFCFFIVFVSHCWSKSRILL
jgi:hypothetical protein